MHNLELTQEEYAVLKILAGVGLTSIQENTDVGLGDHGEWDLYLEKVYTQTENLSPNLHNAEYYLQTVKDVLKKLK